MGVWTASLWPVLTCNSVIERGSRISIKGVCPPRDLESGLGCGSGGWWVPDPEPQVEAAWEGVGAGVSPSEKASSGIGSGNKLDWNQTSWSLCCLGV